MVDSRSTQKYRHDEKEKGKTLSKEEREALIRPYLPAVPAANVQQKQKRKPIRAFLKSGLHFFVYALIHFFFSIYIRLRRYYHALFHQIAAILHYHHRTPELIRKDVRGLSRLPQHLSVVIERSPDVRGRDGLDKLLDEAAEISAWCVCAGIPTLSIYEQSGVLKNYIPTMHKVAAAKLHAYFGEHRPSLQIRAPHMQTFLNGDVSEEGEMLQPNDFGKRLSRPNCHFTNIK
jgi:dehydrodolichyl diphosphate syntase complex subunit NUS1